MRVFTFQEAELRDRQFVAHDGAVRQRLCEEEVYELLCAPTPDPTRSRWIFRAMRADEVVGLLRKADGRVDLFSCGTDVRYTAGPTWFGWDESFVRAWLVVDIEEEG